MRAVVAAQRALRADPSRAAEVGRRLLPPDEAALIEDLRTWSGGTLPRWSPAAYAASSMKVEISPHSVASLNEFCRNTGLLSGDAVYEQVVAGRFAHLWSEQ